MAEVSIRHVRAADLTAALALASRYFGPVGARSLAYCYQTDARLALCSEAESRIISVCFGYPSLTDNVSAILEGLAVTIEWTGQGIATDILAQFENTACRAGYAHIQLGAIDDMAYQFYVKRGYQTADSGCCHAREHVILSKRLVSDTGGHRQRREAP